VVRLRLWECLSKSSSCFPVVKRRSDDPKTCEWPVFRWVVLSPTSCSLVLGIEWLSNSDLVVLALTVSWQQLLVVSRDLSQLNPTLEFRVQ
jgi:hypothetical protein